MGVAKSYGDALFDLKQVAGRGTPHFFGGNAFAEVIDFAVREVNEGAFAEAEVLRCDQLQPGDTAQALG